MKMIALRPCTLLMLLLTFANLNGQTPEQRKIDLEMAFALSAINTIPSGTIYLPNDYVYNAKNEIIGQEFIQNHFTEGISISNEGAIGLYYEGSRLMTFGEQLIGCGGGSTTRLDEYSISLNEQQKVALVEEKQWKNGGKSYFKKRYSFVYEGERLVSISQSEIVGQGKSSLEVKPVFDYVKDASTLNWKSDSELTLTVTSYKDKQKSKDPEIVSSIRNYTIQLDMNRVFQSEITGDRKNEITVITTGNDVVQTYTYSNKTKKVVSYTLDDRKRISKKVIEEFNADQSLKGKSEILFEYQLRESNLPVENICNYKASYKAATFNGAGELIEESTPRQVRKKNADGTWGPWTSYTY